MSRIYSEKINGQNQASVYLHYKANKNGLIIAIMLLLAAISLFFIKTDYFGLIKVHIYGEEFELTCALSSLLMLGLILFSLNNNRRIDWFEPPIWYFIYTFSQVIMNVWLLQRDRQTNIPWLVMDTGSKMTLAVILFDVGLVSICLGYFISKRIHLGNTKIVKSKMALNFSLTIAIWFVTWIIGIISALSGVGGYQTAGTIFSVGWENYFYFISLINIIATSALILHVSRHPTRIGWIWLGVVFLTVLILSVFVGSKRFAINFIWLFMALYYGLHKFPIKLAIIGILLIVTFVPVVNNYREVINSNLPNKDISLGSSIAYRVSALNKALGMTFSQPIEYFLSNTTDTYKDRQAGLLDISASVLSIHPDKVPFVGLEMLNDFFPQLIPRLFWPSKSITRSPLMMITMTYGGASSEYSFSSIGIIADAYRAGGWLFVIFFCGLLGAFLQRVYSKAIEVSNPAYTSLYIVLLSVVLIDREVSTILINLIQFGLLLWLITFKILYRRTIKSN